MVKKIKATTVCYGLFLLSISCIAQQRTAFKPDKALLQTIQQNLTDADAQYKVLMKNLPAGKFPKTYYPEKKEYGFSNSDWWCSGFYPGTLLYLYEETKDEALYKESLRILELLKKEQFNTGTHDLGFMMYCSFGNANRVSSKPEYKEILLNSAKSLSTRFNPKVGCIK